LNRQVPKLTTDAEAEAFLDEDLADLDFAQFKPVQFQFGAEGARVDVRLPEALLDALKERARSRGIPYQHFIREALERAVAQD